MMKDRKKRTTMLSGICLAAVICGMALFSAVNVPAQEKADDAPYVMDARNVYRDVLNGKTQFYYVSKEQKAELTDIGSVPGIFSPYSEYAALWRFAVVDLDQDGEREVVLQVTDVAGDGGGYLALYQQDGKVYGAACDYRMFMNLKADGTFDYANLLLTEQGIGKIESFAKAGTQVEPLAQELSGDGWATVTYRKGGAKISAQEYDREKQLQEQKPDAVWYDFTEEGICQAFESAYDFRLDMALEPLSFLEFLEEANAGSVRDTFPVRVSDGQELTVKLYAKPQQAADTCFAVDKIRIYNGRQWIQTIDPASLPAVEEYAWDGLFVNKGFAVGEPDVRDLNFDGAQDFGLLAVETYPKNVPYSYFLWNKEKQQFDYGFTLFGSKALQVDAEQRKLVEHSNDVQGEYLDFYSYTADGRLVRQQ